MKAIKYLVLFALIATLSRLAYSNITDDQKFLLNHDGLGYHKAQLGDLVNKTRNLLVAKYSFALQGGSSSGPISLLQTTGDKTSFAILPASAVITNVWINVVSAPTSLTAAKIELTAKRAADLLAPTSASVLLAGFTQGLPSGGTVSTFIKVTSATTIKAQITPSTDAFTGGRFDVFIEYVLGSSQ